MASWEADEIISYFLYKLLLCFSPFSRPIRTNNTAVESRLTATSVIWSPHYYDHFFGLPGKNDHTFSCKEILVNTVTLLLQPIFFGPLVTVLMGFHCTKVLVSITLENWKMAGLNFFPFCGFSFQNKQEERHMRELSF